MSRRAAASTSTATQTICCVTGGGASGGQFGFDGTAALVAANTSMDDEPITTEDMRGWLLADGLVMVKYTARHQNRLTHRTSLWRRTGPGRWQIFHHQGTLTTR